MEKMSNILIKGSVNIAELFGDKERIGKTKMLWKRFYDFFGEKGILKTTQ